MKLALLTLTCCAFYSTHAALLGRSREGLLRGSSSDSQESSVGELVHNLISGEGNVRFSQIIGLASKHVTFAQAATTLRQKHALPKEVSSLLETTSTTMTTTLSEASLTKQEDTQIESVLWQLRLTQGYHYMATSIHLT